MRKQILIFIGAFLLAMLSAACAAKNVVVKVPDKASSLKKEGVFYALPRTAVSVEVPLIKLTQKVGKFKKFAKCFFPDDTKKIIPDDKTAFDLGEPVVGSSSEPDPDEVYMVKIKGNYFEDKAITMDWTEGGVLTKGSAETLDRTLDVAIQASKTAVSLLGKGGAFGITGTQGPTVRLDANAKNSLATRCGVNVTDSDFKEAVEIYEKVLSLQLQRENLFSSGFGALPADTLQLMLKELDDLINHYKAMFFGTEAKQTWTARFSVTPLKRSWKKDSVNDFKLFGFSEKAGLCNLSAQVPEVKFLNSGIKDGFNACNSRAKKEDVLLKLWLNDGQFAERINTAFNGNTEDGERGFYYRIPATATAEVLRDRKEISKTQLPIAQLGITASLPASTGGRKTKYEIELYATGALKNFKLGSEALIQDSTVKGFGEAAEVALDKRAEAKKAEAAANNPLANVKSMSELLAECKKIKEAQEALGKPVSLPEPCTR